MEQRLHCLGAIIGDIVGSPYEFVDFSEYQFPLFNKKHSFFTDDTVLTIAIMNALSDALQVPTTQDYAKYLAKWASKYPDCSYGLGFIRWLNSSTRGSYYSCGNGSAMRVSSVAWSYNSIEEVRKEAKKSAEITHNHPEGIKAAEAVASAIFLARKKHTKSEIQQYIENNFDYNLNRSITEVASSYQYSELAQKSVPESIIAFLDSRDFEDAIRLAVYLNGDADTMAAITGSIAEAYYGIPDEICNQVLEFLPQDMLEVIKKFQKVLRTTN